MERGPAPAGPGGRAGRCRRPHPVRALLSPGAGCNSLVLTRTPTALVAFYRRLAARAGKAKAITATARKLALLVYRVLSGSLVYNDPGALEYHQLNRARELKLLRKRAKLLGFDLLDPSTGETAAAISASAPAGEVADEQHGQVSQALRALGIRQILAYSPQARGRSERAFGTIQRRLPQELRHHAISD